MSIKRTRTTETSHRKVWRVTLVALLALLGLLLCGAGAWLLLPAQTRAAAPDPIRGVADGVTGTHSNPDPAAANNSSGSAVAHNGDGTITRVDADEYVTPAGERIPARDTTLPGGSCGGTVPAGFICATGGWINTRPLPVTSAVNGAGQHEVGIPPSKFSGHLAGSAALGAPVTGEDGYVGGRSIIVGHVNFGGWQDTAGIKSAMGGVDEATVGDTVLVGAADGSTVTYRVTRKDHVLWEGLDEYLHTQYKPGTRAHADVVLVTCFFDHTDAYGNPVYDKNVAVTLEAV